MTLDVFQRFVGLFPPLRILVLIFSVPLFWLSPSRLQAQSAISNLRVSDLTVQFGFYFGTVSWDTVAGENSHDIEFFDEYAGVWSGLVAQSFDDSSRGGGTTSIDFSPDTIAACGLLMRLRARFGSPEQWSGWREFRLDHPDCGADGGSPQSDMGAPDHQSSVIQVNNLVEGGQGRRVGPGGVGRADLINQGILDAVDVWGYVTPGVEVCFAQVGRVVFLDAAYAPRKLSDLAAYSRAGMTCATIDRAGTVVLLPGESPPPIDGPAQPEESQPQSRTLSGCEVRPWANLNFRRSPPGGEVISVTGVREWLPASEKHYGYFKVRLWGREGWISGDFVHTRGDCGA